MAVPDSWSSHVSDNQERWEMVGTRLQGKLFKCFPRLDTICQDIYVYLLRLFLFYWKSWKLGSLKVYWERNFRDPNAKNVFLSIKSTIYPKTLLWFTKWHRVTQIAKGCSNGLGWLKVAQVGPNGLIWTRVAKTGNYSKVPEWPKRLLLIHLLKIEEKIVPPVRCSYFTMVDFYPSKQVLLME